MRSDAAANRARILEAAAKLVTREGAGVPMARLAEAAGVGVGTLYRHFPSREELIAALEHRAYELILGFAREAAAAESSPVEAIGRFFESVLAHRDELVLPLHGGPVLLDRPTRVLQTRIRMALRSVLERGRREGTIRGDVTPFDLIVAGSLISQPLPHIPDWDRVARRQIRVYLAGLAAVDAPPLPDEGGAH